MLFNPTERLIRLRTALVGGKLRRKALRASHDPKATQDRVLFEILHSQADTEFGRRHGFDKISSVEEFRRAVPVLDYEALRPLIDEQESTGNYLLNSESPAMYAMTSGTTGMPKYIPVLDRTLKKFAEIQALFLHSQLRVQPGMLEGKILAIVSPAIEGHREGGTPFGSTSGHFYESMPSLVRRKYIVPSAVFSIEDYDLKYLLILRLAIAQDDLTYITTANPSTLSRLIKLLNDNSARLTQDVANGTFHREAELSATVRREIAPFLKANPQRAEKIARLFRTREHVRYQDVWPRLRMVSCWTGGSCGIFLQKLKSEFSPATQIMDIGYLASEFRATIPLFGPDRAGAPTLLWYFFEFVEKGDWEDEKPEFKGLHELEDGKQYYIFVTSGGGLYRYNMNDIVQVEGFENRMPLIRFVQKGKGVTNITGEKLYECQITHAVQKVQLREGLESSFYIAEADEDGAIYRLYYEPSLSTLTRTLDRRAEIAHEIETEIRGINVEYDAKRESGRLKPLSLEILRPGSFDAFKSAAIARGQREGQFKIVALQYKRDIAFDFTSCLATKSPVRAAAQNRSQPSRRIVAARPKAIEANA